MGNHLSTRWHNHDKKQTVETCRRLTPREAHHVGIETVSTSMPRNGGARLWCVCPSCGTRRGVLFQAPGASAWACRACLGLTYRARQTHRVRPLGWRDFQERHPLVAAWRQWKLHTAPGLDVESVQQFDRAISKVLFTEYWHAIAQTGRRTAP